MKKLVIALFLTLPLGVMATNESSFDNAVEKMREIRATTAGCGIVNLYGIVDDEGWKLVSSLDVRKMDGASKNPEVFLEVMKNDMAIKKWRCPQLTFKLKNFAVRSDVVKRMDGEKTVVELVYTVELTYPVRSWKKVTGNATYSIWYKEKEL